MKKLLLILFLAVICSNAGSGIEEKKLRLSGNSKEEQLKKEVAENLTGNILSYWTSKMVDNKNKLCGEGKVALP